MKNIIIVFLMYAVVSVMVVLGINRIANSGVLDPDADDSKLKIAIELLRNIGEECAEFKMGTETIVICTEEGVKKYMRNPYLGVYEV